MRPGKGQVGLTEAKLVIRCLDVGEGCITCVTVSRFQFHSAQKKRIGEEKKTSPRWVVSMGPRFPSNASERKGSVVSSFQSETVEVSVLPSTCEFQHEVSSV